MRRYRGLILAWRDRPDWMRLPRTQMVKVRRRTAVGLMVESEQRISNYQRVKLWTFAPFRNKSEREANGARCRWCRQVADEPRRRNWHSYCLPAYWAATGSHGWVAATLQIEARDRGETLVCEQCGDVARLELDHRDALSVAWASGDDRRLMRSLMLDNLGWLCHACHAVKTGQDRRRMNNLLNGLPQDHVPEAVEPKPRQAVSEDQATLF